MADSFFGFDTSCSNLNDDEGGGEPSEDEYDALNDETFGQDSEEFDWEVEHEHLAEQLESSRRNAALDEADSRLEASISQLVLDETDAPQSRSLGSSVWRHDLSFSAPTPVQPLKNVCTVEELERQLRQNQPPQNFQQNFYQPRFPPVILQRPPGLQAPVPLPFAPQQPLSHMNQPINQMNQSMNQMNQPMNQVNQPMNNIIGQNNQMMNMGNVNQMGQNMNQMGQNVNQMGQNVNQMGQNVNQFMQNSNQMMMNMHQMPPNMNQMPMAQNMNQMGQNMNQMGQNMNQMGQNMNQMGQNMPNGNQFGMNQYMMGPRMMPPPGMNMQRNFSPNINQFNPNFRGPSIPPKNEPITQQNPINQIKPQVNQKSPQKIQKPIQNQPIQNQSIQNQPIQNQTNQNQSMQNQKLKTRVYNNSKTLTSQNLVQLIQNTHPMLQYNNSYHNANHHPILNNRLFNNQIVNHPMFRQNGNYGNRNTSSSDSASDVDEYCGLMSSREKQWLINIQMLQLDTATPYIHDFYYTVFLERQANKEKEGVKEAHKANQQNHPFYSGAVKQESETHRHTRERHNSHRHNSTSEDPSRTYVPAQFENSLGKLQCGSVTAPRKIIDVEVVAEPASGRQSRAPSVASTTNPAEVPRELKRTKQLLLDIEALYLILLRLEELNDPLAISNALILKEREEKQKQLELAQKELENEQEDESNLFLKNIESVQRRPKQDSPKSECIDKRQVVNLAVSQKPPVKNLLDEDKDELLNKMFSGLLFGERLQQILNVRKGRALITRFLYRAPPRHAHLRALWLRVLRALPFAARRDDGGLAALAEFYHIYIQNATGWSAVIESCGILSEALDPARTPYALMSSLTLSCVVTLIEKAILLVNTPEATSNERQWYKFLKTLARALKNTNLTIAKPVRKMSEQKLMQHIKQLESRSTIEILQRGKSADFELTKTDVSEQLIKHLCL